MTMTMYPDTYALVDSDVLDDSGIDPRDITTRACRDYPEPEVFDPDTPAQYREALAVCAACPITELCGAWAQRNLEWGVWGGRLMQRGKEIGPKRPPGRPRREAA